MLERMYDYMREAGLPVQKIENYFPRIWSIEAVRDSGPAIMEKLQELGLSDIEAQRVYNKIAQIGRESDQDNLSDPLSPVPFEGFIRDRAKVLDDPFFEKYQSANLDHTMERYVDALERELAWVCRH